MVIRLVAVPDSLDLTDFDNIFHAVLGWDSGIGYAFQIRGQEFNSSKASIAKPRAKKLRDFRLHRHAGIRSFALGRRPQLDPRP